MAKGAAVHLDAETVRMEVQPLDVLEEVLAQLRIAGAWMSERGIAARCRLAKSVKEIAGALIELERRGQAISQGRDTARALWRCAQAAIPAPQLNTPERMPETQVRRRLPVAAEHPLRKARITSSAPPQPAVATNREVPMSRTDRVTPIVEALRAGPLTRDQIAEKIGATPKRVSNVLFHLKAKGRVQKGGSRTWALSSGSFVVPAAGARHKKARGLPPPVDSAGAHLAVNGQARWFLGNDGSVRIEKGELSLVISAEEFFTLKRAHQCIVAMRFPAEV